VSVGVDLAADCACWAEMRRHMKPNEHKKKIKRTRFRERPRLKLRRPIEVVNLAHWQRRAGTFTTDQMRA
jgi:hypothetical protein